MKLRLVSLVVLLAACSSSSTGPKGVDPTALLIVRAPADARDSMVVTWVACPQTGSCSGVEEMARFVVLPGESLCTHFTPTRNPMFLLYVQLYRYEPNTIDTVRSFTQGFGVNFNETFFKLVYAPNHPDTTTTTGSFEADQLAVAPC